LKAQCEKTMYVIEALIANPHKYGESEKQPLRDHILVCEVCNETVLEFEQMSRGMNHEFDS